MLAEVFTFGPPEGATVRNANMEELSVQLGWQDMTLEEARQEADFVVLTWADEVLPEGMALRYVRLGEIDGRKAVALAYDRDGRGRLTTGMRFSDVALADSARATSAGELDQVWREFSSRTAGTRQRGTNLAVQTGTRARFPARQQLGLARFDGCVRGREWRLEMGNRPLQLLRIRTDHPAAPVVVERPNGEVLATADSLAEGHFLVRVIQGGLRTLPDPRHRRNAVQPPAA